MSSDDSTSSEDDVPSLYPKRFKIQDLYYLNKKSRKATDTSKKTVVSAAQVVRGSHATDPDPISPVTPVTSVTSVDCVDPVDVEDVEAGSVVESLPPLESYLNELLQWKACLPIGVNSIAVQDYDAEKQRLKPHKFILLSSRILTFQDKRCTVWSCECSPSHSSMIAGLPSVMNERFEEVITDVCLHGQAASRLSVEVDGNVEDHGYGHEKTFVQAPYHDGGATLVYSSLLQRKLAVVAVKYDCSENQDAYLYCHGCRIGNCEHLRLVEEDLASLAADDPALAEIDMLLHSDAFRWSNQSNPTAVYQQTLPPVACQPETFVKDMCPAPCLCGEGRREVIRNCRVYYSTSYEDKQVLKEVCPCGENLYDGTNEGIINMGYYAMSHYIMRRYLIQFVTAGMPLFTFYKVWLQEIFINTGENVVSHLRYGMFRLAMHEFMRMMTFDKRSGFQCPACGSSPSRPAFDGMTLGFPKHLLQAKQVLHRNRNDVLFEGSFHKRVFVDNRNARTMLKAYATGDETFTREDLLSSLAVYQPALSSFVDGNSTCPSYARTLMLDLSSAAPVCALLLPETKLKHCCQKLCSGRALSGPELAYVHRYCLPLYFCLEDGGLKCPELVPVVKAMVIIADRTFQADSHPLKPSSAESDLAYYPMLPVLRERGRYALDGQRADTGDCSKSGGRHPTLLPGVFNMMCEHGVCLGFEVMTESESPNTLFSCITSRFQECPKWIIYDNACNALQYSLNRNPAFFSSCRFVSDRLHWPNHKHCSSGHNMNSYIDLQGYNSQVVEQRHSLMLKLSSMLSYMNASNFMMYLTYFHWFHNCLSMGEKAPEPYQSYFRNMKLIFKRN